ncbi:MAG: TlpA disulfide reductase family protein [Gemmatimonadota bacterium]|nr:TlpA disulfide reductase family protein [Gemmatimonadota bacterium]
MTTRRTAKWARGVLVAACLGVAGGCASQERERGAPRVGEPARPYEAATLAGDTVSLESLRGDVVLLNLWATWCTPCREETPYLQEIYEERRDEGFEIVGVSMDTRNQTDAVRMFVDEYEVGYTILHDPAMRAMDIYQALGLPATFLIDREGTLRWLRFGPIPEGDPEFLAALDAVL